MIPARTRRANQVSLFVPSSLSTSSESQATAGDLAVSVPPAHTLGGKSFCVSVKTTSDICDEERQQIWLIYEENMSELYRASSFGWNPQAKTREMFHSLSRYIVARESPTSSPASAGVAAYAIFRFETEACQDVVYCYELQVSNVYMRSGLGTLLTQMLSDVGARWAMAKVMLTVFKANHAAMSFYRSTGFTKDETSPDFSDDPERIGEEEECDYAILSRRIP